MKMILRRHQVSFKNAFRGLIWAFISQPNFKIHLFLSFLIMVAAIYFQLTSIEITILIFAIVFGLGVEMVNTSIESMTDLITKEYREEARIAKDVSAGMMLLTAIGTVIIAFLIFLPKIYSLFIL